MRKSCGVLTVLLAVLAAACSGGSSKDVANPGASNIPAPQQSAVTELPAATSTPTAMEIIDGVAVRTLTVGAPVPLPEGYVFYEVQWSWEGPAVAMQSTYRDPSGVTRVDLLYQTKLVFPSGGPPSGPAISSVAAMPDGRALAIGVCQGFCYGETGPITVISSSDGGITWIEVGIAVSNSWVASAGTDALLVRTEGTVDSLDRDGSFTRIAATPNGQPALVVVRGNAPRVLLRGSDGVTLRAPDSTLFAHPRLPSGGQIEALAQVPASGSSQATTEIDWSMPQNPASRSQILYTGLVNDTEGTFRAIFKWDSTLSAAPSRGLRLTANREIRMVAFPASLFGDRFTDRPGGVYLPAIVDFERGTVSPILEHFADKITGSKSGSPEVIAIGAGPFARVTTGGDCLNVRDKPATASLSLGCFKDGVLLRLRTQPEQTAEGINWLAVETPDRRPGWASAEFLER